MLFFFGFLISRCIFNSMVFFISWFNNEMLMEYLSYWSSVNRWMTWNHWNIEMNCQTDKSDLNRLKFCWAVSTCMYWTRIHLLSVEIQWTHLFWQWNLFKCVLFRLWLVEFNWINLFWMENAWLYTIYFIFIYFSVYLFDCSSPF